MNDFLKGLHRRIDISCVKSNNTLAEIDKMIAAAKKYQYICVFSLPFYTQYLVKKLKEEPNIMVGGTVGFPSGCDTTASKVSKRKSCSILAAVSWIW
jgi:deoxyribose-phosphate aldolase